MTTLAVLGLGQMGAPIARNLATAGFPIRAWNRTSRPGDAPPGVTPAASIAEAVRGADVAITMLADDAAVNAVVQDRGGVVEALPRGALHVSMSTVSLALVSHLAARHAEAGQRFVAAPVFGRPEAAAARKLWVVPGGDAADLAALAPIFAAIGQGTFPMASPAQAIVAKLAGNFMIAGTIELVAEALALGEKGGIAPEMLLELFTGTLFGSPVVQRYGGMVARTEFEPAGFALRLGLKDVGLALEAARALQAPLPVAAVVRDHLVAAIARGRSDIDWAGLATVVREAAGLPPVRPPRG